jgi:predicted TIM-barrel fold metal-dependent hydrolase
LEANARGVVLPEPHVLGAALSSGESPQRSTHRRTKGEHMNKVMVISSDCHAGIPTGDYREYLESRYHDDLADYARSLEVEFQFDPLPFPTEVIAERNEVGERCSFTDSTGRLQDLADNGVVSEVLFPGATPNTAAPWSDFLSAGVYRSRTPRLRELAAAGERAYNRWIAEFCASVPIDRRIGLAFLPIHDVDAAVAEAKWAGENGLRGVVLPFFNYDLPEYCHGWYWDRVWAACEEANLSLNFHGGYGLPEFGTHQEFMSLEHLFFAKRPLIHMIFDGVFDRYPKLNFAITEAFAGWVPDTMAQLDALFETSTAANLRKKILFDTSHLPQRKPSEYWAAQGFVGASIVNVAELEARHEIGVQTMMFGIDYPHPEGSWGNAALWLRASFGVAGVSEGETRQILGANAARCYGIDPANLAPVVEQVGPSIDTILASATDEEINALLEDSTATGRALGALQYGRVRTDANTGL